MTRNYIVDDTIELLQYCVDEILVLGVAGGYMFSAISGIGEVPVELLIVILAYYFAMKQVK